MYNRKLSRAMTRCCLQEFTAAVVTCTKRTQEWTRRCFIMDQRRDHGPQAFQKDYWQLMLEEECCFIE